MSNEWNGHRTALALFALAAIIAILAAFVTTLEWVDVAHWAGRCWVNERPHPAGRRRAPTPPPNVRSGAVSIVCEFQRPIPMRSAEMLSGVKQTSRCDAVMSAFDPYLDIAFDAQPLGRARGDAYGHQHKSQ